MEISQTESSFTLNLGKQIQTNDLSEYNTGTGTITSIELLNDLDTIINVGEAQFSINETEYKETSSINIFSTDGTLTSTNMGFDIPIEEIDLENKIACLWIYIDSQETLNKIAVNPLTTKISPTPDKGIKLYARNTENVWLVYIYPVSRLAVGWNYIELDISNPNYTESGNPTSYIIDKFRVRIMKSSIETVFNEGEIAIDYIHHSLHTRDSMVGKYALSFNSDDVEYKAFVPDSRDLWETGDMSFSLWIKPTNIASNQFVWCHYNWRFVFSGSRIKFTVGRMNSGTGPFFEAASLQDLENDEIYHLVGIYHPDSEGGGYIKLYINGVLQDTTSIGSNLIYEDYNTSRNLQWGNSGHGAAVPYEGIIDESIIYKRILTQEEITTLANKGEVTGADVKYSFEEGAGTILYDSSKEPYTQIAPIELTQKSNEFTLSQTENQFELEMNQEIETNDLSEYVTGTINNATWVDGIVGKYALEFKKVESSSSVSFPQGDWGITESQKMSLSAWVYWTDGETYDSIFDNEQYQPGVTARGWTFRLQAGKGVSFSYGDRFEGVGTWGNTNTPNDLISLNTWYHIVATWDGAEVKIYIDGDLKATGNHSHPIAFGPVTPSIGAIRGGSNFTGKIDEVRIYNLDLTQEEVNTLYSKGDVTRGLVGKYDFEEGTGNLAYDSHEKSYRQIKPMEVQ